MISPWRWVAAASVLVLLAAGAVIFYRKPVTVPGPIENQIAAAKAIHPGTNKAHLQLSNGAVIELDTAQDGSIAFQGASKIVKNGSTISYSAAKGAVPINAYNVLTTPRAGQFQMVLPDGTKVWLNNASTLKYPVDFSGDRRQVELSGEAYFEVAKSAGKPFRVITPSAGIEVLGTSFNVSSYVDEQFQKTTLVEGKVRVTSASDNLVLTPGEQAEAANGKLSVNHPDVYSVTAWRRGFFNFSNADIQTVMRQIARWYDVTVVYEGEPSKEKLEGSISRNQNLAETLAALDALHIHASVKDRTVTVHP
jgi:ferric-dicitrate binding protein FerR (iron transport regulator)